MAALERRTLTLKNKKRWILGLMMFFSLPSPKPPQILHKRVRQTRTHLCKTDQSSQKGAFFISGLGCLRKGWREETTCFDKPWSSSFRLFKRETQTWRATFPRQKNPFLQAQSNRYEGSPWRQKRCNLYQNPLSGTRPLFTFP